MKMFFLKNNCLFSICLICLMGNVINASEEIEALMLDHYSCTPLSPDRNYILMLPSTHAVLPVYQHNLVLCGRYFDHDTNERVEGKENSYYKVRLPYTNAMIVNEENEYTSISIAEQHRRALARFYFEHKRKKEQNLIDDQDKTEENLPAIFARSFLHATQMILPWDPATGSSSDQEKINEDLFFFNNLLEALDTEEDSLEKAVLYNQRETTAQHDDIGNAKQIILDRVTPLYQPDCFIEKRESVRSADASYHEPIVALFDEAKKNEHINWSSLRFSDFFVGRCLQNAIDELEKNK